MSKVNDGGPAFPFEYELGEGLGRTVHTGVSLRDYAAIKLMASLVIAEGWPHDSVSWQTYAKTALAGADALIQSREASNG